MNGSDDILAALTRLVSGRAAVRRPVLLGVTGSVAVGKSSFAERVRAALEPDIAVEIVSTDSFLFPNDVLAERGQLLRKGFPETFDIGALAAFVAAMRVGEPAVTVPVYDHATFDVVPGQHRLIGDADVVLLEGVVLPDGLDLVIYLDAATADIERWFTDRFVEQVGRAADSPGGFYDMFVGMSEPEVRDVAGWTWREINLPNLSEHIAPTRADADLVITKAADHTFSGAELTRGGPWGKT